MLPNQACADRCNLEQVKEILTDDGRRSRDAWENGKGISCRETMRVVCNCFIRSWTPAAAGAGVPPQSFGPGKPPFHAGMVGASPRCPGHQKGEADQGNDLQPARAGRRAAQASSGRSRRSAGLVARGRACRRRKCRTSSKNQAPAIKASSPARSGRSGGGDRRAQARPVIGSLSRRTSGPSLSAA